MILSYNTQGKPQMLTGDALLAKVKELSKIEEHDADIIHIEEIKTMKKYEQLENQIAEMQKEIARLKKEETKVPEIKEIEVTRTIIYAPDAYLQYCEESGVTPTQDGFIDYIADEFDDDFSIECSGHQDIKVIEA